MPWPRTQRANLPACSPQPPINAERQARKLYMPFCKVFWYDSTRGLSPRSTDCEADALTTTPSRRSLSYQRKFDLKSASRRQNLMRDKWNPGSVDRGLCRRSIQLNRNKILEESCVSYIKGTRGYIERDKGAQFFQREDLFVEALRGDSSPLILERLYVAYVR